MTAEFDRAAAVRQATFDRWFNRQHKIGMWLMYGTSAFFLVSLAVGLLVPPLSWLLFLGFPAMVGGIGINLWLLGRARRRMTRHYDNELRLIEEQHLLDLRRLRGES